MIFLYIFRPSEVDPQRIGLINVYMYELATFRVYLTSFLSQYSVPGSILYHTASVGNIHTRRMFGSVCGRIETKTHQIIAFSLHLGSIRVYAQTLLKQMNIWISSSLVLTTSQSSYIQQAESHSTPSRVVPLPFSVFILWFSCDGTNGAQWNE